jgi:hypothetical protein
MFFSVEDGIELAEDEFGGDVIVVIKVLLIIADGRGFLSLSAIHYSHESKRRPEITLCVFCYRKYF